MSLSIWVVGAPRTGSWWLTRLLADLMGVYDYDTDGLIFTSELSVNHAHKIERVTSGSKTVYITRDPRDVLVSNMHFWDLESIRDMLLVPVWGHGKVLPSAYIWLDLATYFHFNPPAVIVTFEEMIENLEAIALRLCSAFGIDASGEQVRDVCERQLFQARKSTMPAKTRSPLRKGIVGDWKNQLKRDEAEIIHRTFWLWMSEYKYESDPHWWEKVPS